MSRLHFSYRMELKYEKEVSKCYFTMKCIPKEDLRQKLLHKDIVISPETTFSYGEDSFGNKQIYGCADKTHQNFSCSISGMVETTPGYLVQDVAYERLGMYKYPHGMCVPGERIRELHRKMEMQQKVELHPETELHLETKMHPETEGISMETELKKAKVIMDFLYQNFRYEAGITNTKTTAEQALVIGKGVCQDYAHIFIALLRMSHIPARYVCGFVLGKGESHAWVEAACQGEWIGFDPTSNDMVTEHYIKLGDGRDAADCSINRGIMWGGGAQTQNISVIVEEEK